MNKKIIIYLFVLVLLVNIVIAPPPFIAIEENVNGIQIEHALIINIPLNSDYTFLVDTFNISNGLEIDGVDTNCVLHIHDNLGREIVHIDNMTLISDGNFLRYETNISGSNFTRIGFYDFLIYCSTDTIGGFVRESFEVTQEGFSNRNDNILPLIVGFGIIMLVFLVLAIVGLSNQKTSPMLKYFGMFSIAFMFLEMVIMIFVMYALNNGTDVTNILRINFLSALIIGFGLLMFMGWLISVKVFRPEGEKERTW